MSDEVDEILRELEESIDLLAYLQAKRKYPDADPATLLAKRDEIKAEIWKLLAKYDTRPKPQ